MSLLSNVNTFVPQISENISPFFEKIESNTDMLLLPDEITSVVDGFYVEKFGIDRATEEITGEAIITIYTDKMVVCRDDMGAAYVTGTSFAAPWISRKLAYPFYARATLAYFPHCDRNQGVDYTSTEMDIHFGRVVAKRGSTTIKAIDDNQQSEDKLITLYEEDARKMYRKLDNIKYISEEIKDKRIRRKAYDSGLWGLKISTRERLQKRKSLLQFRVVVTLKEMNGVNRIDDFVKMCLARGWLVSRLDIENQLDVYAKAEEEIEIEI